MRGRRPWPVFDANGIQPNSRRRPSAGFRPRIVVTEIAEHLGVTAKTLHEGVRAIRPPAPERLTADERSELANRLQRRFHPRTINRCWVADLTYLDTAEGWLYLAVVLDLCSRRVGGWALRPTLHTEVTIAALRIALERRRPRRGLVHHSDRGIQYASTEYQALLAACGDVHDYIERFYNPVRLHSTLDYQAPAAFEAAR